MLNYSEVSSEVDLLVYQPLEMVHGRAVVGEQTEPVDSRVVGIAAHRPGVPVGRAGSADAPELVPVERTDCCQHQREQHDGKPHHPLASPSQRAASDWPQGTTLNVGAQIRGMSAVDWLGAERSADDEKPIRVTDVARSGRNGPSR
jgi:hypothetical protein